MLKDLEIVKLFSILTMIITVILWGQETLKRNIQHKYHTRPLFIVWQWQEKIATIAWMDYNSMLQRLINNNIECLSFSGA